MTESIGSTTLEYINGPMREQIAGSKDALDNLADITTSTALKLDAIREVLDREPECDVHDDDDLVTCGWMRDIQDIRKIVNGEQP